MRKRYTAQNLYKTTLVNPVNGISASGAGDTVFEVVVNDTPSTDLTEGFLVIDYNDVDKRDFIKFHNVSGSTFYYYRKDRDLLGNGSLTIRHDPGAYVQINVVMEYHKHLYDNLDDFGYIEDFRTNNFKVYGGIIDTPSGQATIADTSFASVADGTWYVFFDYADNTFKLLADTTGYYGLSVATVVVASGDISTITDTRPMVMPVRYDPDVFAVGDDGELKLINNTTISDATTLSAGRVRLGTLTDHQSQTAGAVVVQTSNLVKTPDATPANDENKVPILSSDGYVDSFVSFAAKYNYIGESSVGTDAYAVTAVPAITSYEEGMRISFKADVANTGACTININSLGVKNIKTIGGGTPSDGAIKVGINELYYDGTNMVILNPSVSNNDFYFGDGSDGTVTISVDTTLTSDMNYVDLTINSGITLYTDGYRIFVQGTLTNNGFIRRDGSDGGDGGDATASSTGYTTALGGAAGTTPGTGTLEDATTSGDGGDSQTQEAGGDGGDANPGYNNVDGGNGGAGGGGGGAGGSGGTTTRGYYYNILGRSDIHKYLMHPASFDSTLWTSVLGTYSKYKSIGGAGGGGAGGRLGSSNSWGGGGGGAGGNGGVIYIAAKTIDNSSGTISAIGGNGGNGGNGSSAGISGGGGGGAGGSGGVVIMIYSLALSAGTINVSGGTGGTGGAGFGGSVDGGDGDDGTAGLTITHIV